MSTIKSYTDINQSKKLAEILPLESADQTWERIAIAGANLDVPEELQYRHNGDMLFQYYSGIGIPCWSLAALMNLLPSKFTEKGKYSETTYEIHIRKYALTEDVDLYQIAYGNYKFYEDGNSSWKDMINTGEKENLIDTAFDMICWLKENNKL